VFTARYDLAPYTKQITFHPLRVNIFHRISLRSYLRGASKTAMSVIS
jgi:hypothetical protein